MSRPSPPGSSETAAAGEPETIVLDACVVINLYASRHFKEILSDLPYRFAVAEKVFTDETLYVRRGGEGDDAFEKDPLTLQPAISASILEVLSLSGEHEAATFVSLAAELDDGEAATGAIALHRGYGVATDDRKARKRLGQADVPTHSTLELLKEWCEIRGLSDRETAALLSDVRVRGRFVPPRGDPLQSWWDTYFPSGT